MRRNLPQHVTHPSQHASHPLQHGPSPTITCAATYHNMHHNLPQHAPRTDHNMRHTHQGQRCLIACHTHNGKAGRTFVLAPVHEMHAHASLLIPFPTCSSADLALPYPSNTHLLLHGVLVSQGGGVQAAVCNHGAHARGNTQGPARKLSG